MSVALLPVPASEALLLAVVSVEAGSAADESIGQFVGWPALRKEGGKSGQEGDNWMGRVMVGGGRADAKYCFSNLLMGPIPSRC